MDIRYVAAVEAFARFVDEMFVPLVAVELNEYHQPFGFSNVTLVKLLQSENAPEPMLVTLSGIVMLVRPVQKPNASLLMLVTLLGIVMLVRLLHP